MKRIRKLPELLAPAGSIEALIAAIAGGADAVYLGGLKFGARAYAKNFADEEMIKAVKLCHMFGVRLYVTINTLIYQKEMEEAFSYVKKLHDIGVDALIIADLGLAARIKREIPEMELHASTQMGVHNKEGADFAQKLGCNRVVLARECSENDISDICEKSAAECEVFVHGALCVCHSGQCLFSSMIGGRSGNRGECAQPCRLPYNKDKYILSLRDLSLSNHINSLIDAGVSSLKIEGRMKSPSYVYEVTKIYRKLLDERREANAQETRHLSDVFSRSGFTDGYYKSQIFSNMLGIRTDEEKEKAKNNVNEEYKLPKIKIRAEARFKEGEPASLSLYARVAPRWDNAGEIKPLTVEEICVNSEGQVPERAENSPLTYEGVTARLSKTGSTPFELSEDDIALEIEEGINLPPSAINALRRNACDKLESEFLKTLDKIVSIPCPSVPFSFKKEDKLSDSDKTKNIKTALFFNTDVLLTLNEKNKNSLTIFDNIFVPLFKYASMDSEKRDIVKGVYLPPVIMEHEWGKVISEFKDAVRRGVKFALIGNISHLALCKECGAIPFGDFRLNISNNECFSLWKFLGVENLILSAELTLPMVRDIGGGAIILGRIPLMITERCFMKENFGCEKCSLGKVELVDRKGIKFPMMREFEHRNIIFNSQPTYMGDKREELTRAKIKHEHFVFSSETPEECYTMIDSYIKGKTISVYCRRMGRR